MNVSASSSSNPACDTSGGLDMSPLPVTATTPKNVKIRIIRGEEVQLPADFDEDRSLYRPHGKWAWTNGLEILSDDPGTRLGYGLEGQVHIKLGQIEDQEIVYISKLISVWDRWRLLFSYLYLSASSKYLRPLQGICVPWIIGVYHCNGGRIGIAQDLPHPMGWREADMFLEEEQKEAIIGAYEKLHERGILHGDAEYRHWLLGDDGKATIIDFGFTRVLRCDEGAKKANVDVCSKWEIQTEMRKVKFMLDYEDSRETEYRLARLRHAREENDRAQRVPSKVVDHMLQEQPQPPPTPMTEEEKESPLPALRLSDLEDWSCGDQWTAHHFQVIRLEDRATIRKTVVPQPPTKPDHIPTTVSLSATTSKSTVIIGADVVDAGRQVLLHRAGPRPIPGPSNVSMSEARKANKALKRPREHKDLDEDASRENDSGTTTEVDSTSSSESGSDTEITASRSKGNPVDRCGRENKRQRMTEVPRLTTTPNEMQTRPPPLIRSLDTFYKPSPTPVPCPAKRATSTSCVTTKRDSGNNAQNVSGAQSTSDASNASGSAIRKEALRSWSLFCKSRKHAEQLQSQLDAQKWDAEQHRHDFLRAILNIPGGERKSLLDSIGQRDSLSILDLFPDRPKQVPGRDASAHLRDRRVQLVRTVANSQTSRIPSRQRKEFPRVADIKRLARADFSPKVPSQLGRPAENKAAREQKRFTAPSSSLSRSIDTSGPSSKLKAALQHMEQYRAIIMRRAQLEEEQEKGEPSSRVQQYKEHVRLTKKLSKERKELDKAPPRPPTPRLLEVPEAGPSQSSTLPGGNSKNGWSKDKIADIKNLEGETLHQIPVSPNRGPITASEFLANATPSEGSMKEPHQSTHRRDYRDDSDIGIGVPNHVGKRKRDESDEDFKPNTKKSKSGGCGMM